jgi:hypothetical protein
MNYTSTIPIESKSSPGVRFTIRKMTKGRRDILEDQQAPFREKLRPLYEELGPLDKERAEATEAKQDFPADKLRRWSELLAQIGRIDHREMEPQAVRFVLVSIEGLDIDGEPAKLDAIMERGPDELYDEILAAVKRELGLLPAEASNLPLPSTSAAVVDGSPTPGSAAPAEKQDTTTSAAA